MRKTDTKDLSHEAVAKEEQTSLPQTVQCDIGIRLSILADKYRCHYIYIYIYIYISIILTVYNEQN